MNTPFESNPEQEPAAHGRQQESAPDSGWDAARPQGPGAEGDATTPAQPTAQVPAQPTAQVPAQPTFGQPPWQPAHSGPFAGWSAPPGAVPPGATPPGAVPPGGPAPPYGTPGYVGGPMYPGSPGPWGQPPWAGGATAWSWGAPADKQARRRPATTILTLAVAAGVAIAAVAGVLIGHAVWSNASASSNSPPSASSPFGNSGGSTNPFGNAGGSGSGSSGNSGSGSGSSAAGGPADAASIAQNVDPGLVDVNTSITYQGLQGAGTGIVLTPDGEVLTNNHVVEGATSISVTDVGNGKTYNATVLGYDRNEDVALLQLQNASGLQTVSLGDSSKVSVGEGVVAIGNANGAGGTPSYAGGSVTATNQSITASDEVDGSSEQLTNLIETNADIISGDSGGPLVNSSGQVLGMDTAGSSSGSGGFQFQSPTDEGYAIPINEALGTARQIKAGTASATVHIGPTAFLGVEVAASADACSGGLGSGGSGFGFGSGGSSGSSPSSSGAVVCEAVTGDPAAQAGIAADDTITSVDGHSVNSPASLTDVMTSERAGATVPVRYVDSSGQQQTTSVTLGTGPPQ